MKQYEYLVRCNAAKAAQLKQLPSIVSVKKKYNKAEYTVIMKGNYLRNSKQLKILTQKEVADHHYFKQGLKALVRGVSLVLPFFV